ncbi:MarR family transcriptional regulator [Phytoactinopolyspora alkaliphila]|uniref:MarR family transcriptional regulator n=1 Tax=Phytoactinopolyspora alkaliphila TaxID=1783498 RepID=A0A6N9YJ60_9ACTN|nr:MarR family transcriptional regulator [Phytoactinopolyspora alkaliphila]NED94909.1 MarR family transcriptional regulator [Phytoactinopolyspora alkaliphila]
MSDAVEAVLAQWSRERPDVDNTPMSVIARVMRLSRLLDRRLKDFLAGHGLEPGEFDVLTTLRRSGAPYSLSAREFRVASLVTSGAITNRVDRMMAKGLVDRTPDTHDRRSVQITLTPRGLDLIDRLYSSHIKNYERFLSALDHEEQARLADGLRSVIESLENEPEA